MLSAELEKMKDTNLKLSKVFKYKVTPKGKTNNQVNPKGENKKSPKHHNYDNYAWNKVPPKKCKKETGNMYEKAYNWCKWHKVRVENNPEVKESNGCRLRKKFGGEYNPRGQEYAWALN